MSAPCPVFGATVHAELRPDADAGSHFERFSELLASRGLVSTGPAWTTWDLVVSSEAGQMTESDRQAIVDWLGAERGFAHAVVSPLGDLR